MNGPALDPSAVTGMKAGIADAVAFIQTSVNDQYMAESAVMFIGVLIGIYIAIWIIKGHKGTGLGGEIGASNGMSVSDKIAMIEGRRLSSMSDDIGRWNAAAKANGVTDAALATRYLDSGGDIRNASNQEFIREWAKTPEANSNSKTPLPFDFKSV